VSPYDYVEVDSAGFRAAEFHTPEDGRRYREAAYAADAGKIDMEVARKETRRALAKVFEVPPDQIDVVEDRVLRHAGRDYYVCLASTHQKENTP